MSQLADTAQSVTGAQAGIGAYQNSGGTGDITITLGSNVAVAGTSLYGIQANSLGTGSINVDYRRGG